MNGWIEPPPPTKRRGGCFKGCLFIALFLLLVLAAIAVISYRSVTSAKLPDVVPDPVVQQEARERWDQFEQTSRGENSAATDAAVGEQPAAAPQPARVEFTADEINQLIAANRKARGKAFVRIDNNVGYVQVSIPLKKLNFGGRQLVASGEIHASPDRDPRKVMLRNVSVAGVEFPESVLNTVVGGRSLASYVDQYTQEYQITGFAIENNRAILESNQAGR